ncbi:neurogenic locus notch [Legionella sp. W05-934-2]|uniref:neurogenic locus notch n=1 Tax=Legionella sp. W05-934-2 TaxID=1198649 RepID=UPI0034633B7B
MKKILPFLMLICLTSNVYACFGSGSASQCPRDCGKGDTCCKGQGGISYCDSSAGRYVCNYGGYSSCYCTRHAVMDVQNVEGCCVWQGGVLKISPKGMVICNNGGVSEMCSRVFMKKPQGTI